TGAPTTPSTSSSRAISRPPSRGCAWSRSTTATSWPPRSIASTPKQNPSFGPSSAADLHYNPAVSSSLGECSGLDCLSDSRLRQWIAGRPPADAERDREHLTSCHACRAVIAFARTSTLSMTASADGTPAPVPMLKRGASVGRYVIVDVLGAGGMGVVYSAY